MPPDNYLTTVQAAEMLGRGINLIAKLCQSGRLPGAEKIGNAWLIPRESVVNYKPMKRGAKTGTPRGKGKNAAMTDEEIKQALKAAAANSKEKQEV